MNWSVDQVLYLVIDSLKYFHFSLRGIRQRSIINIHNTRWHTFQRQTVINCHPPTRNYYYANKHCTTVARDLHRRSPLTLFILPKSMSDTLLHFIRECLFQQPIKFFLSRTLSPPIHTITCIHYFVLLLAACFTLFRTEHTECVLYSFMPQIQLQPCEI